MNTIDVVKRWNLIIKMKQDVDTEARPNKYWFNGLPSTHLVRSVVLKSAYTLVFLQAHTLLKDIQKSNFYKGQSYKNAEEIQACDNVRNGIAHNYHLIDPSKCERLLKSIEIELHHWNLL